VVGKLLPDNFWETNPGIEPRDEGRGREALQPRAGWTYREAVRRFGVGDYVLKEKRVGYWG